MMTKHFQDTKSSISDGSDSYEEFQLSLQQMEQHYLESDFHEDDQEIQKLSRPTFADYGQNEDTTSAHFEYHHHDLHRKILPDLTSFSLFSQSLQGDIQGMQPLVDQGDQESEALYKNFVETDEVLTSFNAEASIHRSGVDYSDAAPDGAQVRSMVESILQHGSNLKSRSRRKRCRYTQEDLLKLRNYYNNSPANSSRNPNFSECLRLSYDTDLDYKQVSTWFSNTRERARESGDAEVIISTNRKRHSDSSITLLKAWVAKNEPNDPTPTTKERRELAQETGLSLEQVSGWFMTLRKNRKAALRKEL